MNTVDTFMCLNVEFNSYLCSVIIIISIIPALNPTEAT